MKQLSDNEIWHLGWVLDGIEARAWLEAHDMTVEEFDVQCAEAKERWNIT